MRLNTSKKRMSRNTSYAALTSPPKPVSYDVANKIERIEVTIFVYEANTEDRDQLVQAG